MYLPEWREHRLKTNNWISQFNESSQTTWATAPNHVHILPLWQMWSKTLSRTDFRQAGVTMFSLPLAQLMSSCVSNQESHPSLQGGHSLFFWFRLRKIRYYQQPPALALGEKGVPGTVHWGAASPIAVALLSGSPEVFKSCIYLSGAECRTLLWI